LSVVVRYPYSSTNHLKYYFVSVCFSHMQRSSCFFHINLNLKEMTRGTIYTHTLTHIFICTLVVCNGDLFKYINYYYTNRFTRVDYIQRMTPWASTKNTNKMAGVEYNTTSYYCTACTGRYWQCGLRLPRV